MAHPPSQVARTPWQLAANLTVDAVVRERAHMHPLRDALVQGEQRISFEALMRRVDNLSSVLRQQGVTRNDRVAVLSENRIEYVEAVLAAGVLGAIACCSNWRQSDAELAHCFRLTQPMLTLTSARHHERLRALNWPESRTLVFGEAYEKALNGASRGDVASAAEAEDGLIIMYTSGTTGHPKAAVISHRAEIARAATGIADGQLYPGRGGICWSPFYHIAGMDHALGLLMQGDPVFVVDGFQPGVLVEIMAQESLGTVSLMPSAIGRVIEELRRTGLRPRSLMACGSMADLVPRQLIAEVSGLLGAEFRNSFGATETGQAPASRHRFPAGVLPATLSKRQSSYCVLRLVDENDQDVPDGVPGEVLVRSPALFSGYWSDPQATREAFRDGWYHMGDMMVRNADGSLDFVDRRKYLIKSGGENIYPAEIERVLLADARVKDAAVIRKKDAHWGEIPVVFVVPAAPITPEAIVALCRRQLAGYKIPKEVYFIGDEEMPRSETAKVKRFELEKRLEITRAESWR